MNTIRLFKTLSVSALILGMSIFVSITDLFAQSNPDCGSGARRTDYTSSGTDFLLVYMQNDQCDPNDPDPSPSPSNYQDLYLGNIEPVNQVTVTITCAANGYSKQVVLAPGASQAIRLNANPTQSMLVCSEGTVDNTVVVVHSTGNIVCYGMNHKVYTADAFLALPKQVAKQDYMVMTYYNSTDPIFTPQFHPAEFAVAAFNDSTTVTITTPDGATANYILNANQCVQIQYMPLIDSGDLTGTMVHSSDIVAVYSGHRRTEVPNAYTYLDANGLSHSSRDHVAEAVPPLRSWGKAFIARNFPPRQLGDVMRVLSSANNNTVTINGVPWGKPLNAGQYRDTLIPFVSGLPDSLRVKNIYAVQTSQPSLVGMFMHTANSLSGLGDPFLAFVPPVDQTIHSCPYFISTDPVYTSNFLVIATDTSSVGKISINNSPPIPEANYVKVLTPLNVLVNNQLVQKKYAVAVIDQQPYLGMNKISSSITDDSKGFTILAYGMGIVDSYGYTAGGLFAPTHGIMPINDGIGLPYPTPGNPPPPSFTIRNIIGDGRIFIDSIRMTYSSNPEHIDVVTKNIPMTYPPNAIPVGGTQKIILAPEKMPTLPIIGTVLIYHHSGLWLDLEPINVDFTVEAGTQSKVAAANEPASASHLYPNPVTGVTTTLQFTLPSSSNTIVTIYDALGRSMMTPVDMHLSEGEQSFRIDTHSLSDGTYFYELSAPEAGVTEHGAFSVMH